MKKSEHEPSRLLLKLAGSLFPDPAAREGFVAALSQPAAAPGAVLWLTERPIDPPFETEPRLAWQPPFVDRVSAALRPGRHPLHQDGAFYCLDFSSVLAASPIASAGLAAPRILDMCSAPGGKAVFTFRATGGELYCNEIIKKRVPALISNLKRCRISGAKVLSRDSSFFAEAAARCFDLVLVDAPCSGQSLIARGEKSPGCFHPATINMNANRQKRIIANSARCVRPGGFLAYMTCTYSREENEAVVEWLLERVPGFSVCEVEALSEQRSELADFPCYRMWPQSGLGAGAFTALLRYEGSEAGTEFDSVDLPVFWSSPFGPR